MTTHRDPFTIKLLERFRERAAEYDSENRFFAEDFANLRMAGYLAAPVPEEMGGAGFTLDELARSQRRLAAHAPATALGVNMHLVWVQVARFLHDRGDSRLDWVLRDAVAGEVFALGISEPGNDAVLLDTHSVAEPDANGGYRISGTKVSTTLSPVWTRLGLHARDDSDPERPRVVLGFARREAAGVRTPADAGVGITHPGTWNPLGMRATQSWTTKLTDVTMLPEDVAASFAPHDATDPIVLGIFSAFSVLTAAVYAGIADRALELAAEAARRPAVDADGGEGTRLDDPDTAARLTEALLDHRSSLDAIELLARDVDAKSDRGDWFLALAAVKNRSTDEARRAVDVAMRLVGARGFQADSELARLYRDVLAGLFHPSSSRALASTVRRFISD
jgi:alkylation response protein AidB-like acyl-CoA dehydrogenase